MTAREILEAFLTPPKVPEFTREGELRAAAISMRLRLGEAGFARGGGDEVAVYKWGAGPPVLLVHGWGGRATNFAALIGPLIEAGLGVVGFDAPAHGQSSGTLSSGPAFAAAIELVEAYEGPFHAIVAHSLGALASTCAQGRGVKVGKVVYLGACCRVEPLLVEFITRFELRDGVEQELFRVSADEFGPEEISADKVAPRLADTAAILMHDPEDGEMPYDHSVALAAAWPHAQLVPTPGVGHRRILRARDIVRRTLDHVVR
ncbi:MAG TPA: alpha/beta fold hydrolase [Terrimicrobiaceae bacterium]|nr:alpha/beta fold hydrolase [Terrimicrobiaceae bacterium]